MIDLRYEIIALAEDCLHFFIIERLNFMNIGDRWRVGLKSFVESQYQIYPQNMKSLYSFLSKHSVDEVNIYTLDITAICPLLLYYDKFKALYLKDQVGEVDYYSYVSCFHDFQNIRNLIKHYVAEIPDDQKNVFVIDQFDAICCIVRFAVLCVKNSNDTEHWKEKISRALYLQGKLRREKWFIIEAEKNNDISPDDDLSDIEYAAENGDDYAQTLLGKMYYEGTRFEMDRDKAFMWFFKASRQKNIEAMFYLARCYQKGYGVDYDYEKGVEWFKKSADGGYAPSQFELASLIFPKIVVDESELTIMIDLLNKSVEQNYLPAVWMLGLCYEMGRGVEKNLDIAKMYEEKAAMNDYLPAAECLADKAVKNGDDDIAKKWYEIAAKNNSKNAINALERYGKRGHF